MKNKNASVEQYLSGFPEKTQVRLKLLQLLIKQISPEAEESISYGMPAYKLAGKPLVYFAGYEKHIGLYALPSGHQKFKSELSSYKQGKGSVQFPINQPLPLALIKKIVKFRVTENLSQAKVKKLKKIQSE